MINNRQNGRRRGRGGQRPQGNPGRPDQGNRIDNRARGNAQQLHEKYKNLARDAQMAGDRVTTEYYLQFADHYFRVLNETRARFEDQRRQRDETNAEEEFEDIDEFDPGPGGSQPREQRDQREHREPRQDRGDRQPRRDEEQNQPVEARDADAGDANDGDDGRRNRRNRRRREDGERDVAPSIEADRLPPAISVETTEEPAAEAPRRRRRTRVETANDQVEVPPAA